MGGHSSHLHVGGLRSGSSSVPHDEVVVVYMAAQLNSMYNYWPKPISWPASWTIQLGLCELFSRYDEERDCAEKFGQLPDVQKKLPSGWDSAAYSGPSV